MKRLYGSANASDGGVYRILNLSNGRRYFGSTKCFYKRANNHFNNLMGGTHTNSFLQNDFVKCGQENFLFEVLEIVQGTTEDCLAVEQTYLDKHYDNQKHCYNIEKEARANRMGSRAKQPPNPLTDKRCKSPSLEVKTKRALASAIAKRTPEARAKAAENCKNGLWAGHSAGVTLVNKNTQETVEVTGSLREFALQRGLSYKALHLMVRGKVKSSGGWVKSEKTI